MPGDAIELNFGTYEIVDYFEAGNVFESGVLFMRLDDLQQLTSSRGNVTFFFIELDSGVEENGRKRVIAEVEALSPVLKVVTTEEFLDQNQLTAAVRGLGRVILVTNALLSVFIISTIMVLTVSEKSKELAILRAIGWSTVRVGMLVILETSLLSAAATALGGIVGWVGLKIALTHLRTMGIYSQSVLTLEHLLLLFGSAVVIATLGAVLPVYYTLNISVSEALRE
jgi:putative ABC transport system permease protein